MDDNLKGEQNSFGTTKNIEVEPEFFMGGLRQELRANDIVKENLKVR